MHLFISYSRDDKAWVYELWRALRDRAHHDAWIDQRIIPAQDWWDSILQGIEACETFIYVMTPKSTESIYCCAELAYALALNKPILPLMLKTCDQPAELKRGRIQYYMIADTDSLGDVLFTTERGLSEIRVGLVQGQYPTPSPLPPRPDEPKPARQPEQVSEVFLLAEEAASENNITLAEKLFQQVIDADSDGYGLAAAERLGEIRFERSRNADYLNIMQMAATTALRKGALALWRVYLSKYGADYDPNGLAAVLAEKPVAAVSLPPTQLAPAHPRTVDLLPPPFKWCEIPAGKVTLEEGGYVPKGGKTFDVSAFAIAKYPITNAQFAKFIQANGYQEQRWWTAAGWDVKAKERWTQPRFWTDPKWTESDYPVVGVSWYEALAFCCWLSFETGEKINLPTEQQWQRAAQGDDGRRYPWGNEWDDRRCNSSSSQTTPVVHFEGQGDSPFGVVDMVGNVWEWCLTSYQSGSVTSDEVYSRVLRGGSWGSDRINYVRVSSRTRYSPEDGYYGDSFRIACSS